MKYLAIASLAAFAAASPALDARDGWEAVKPATTKWVDPAQTWYNVPAPTKKAGAEWDEWNKKPVYTTTVVTAITTYCPEPTTLYHAGKTWVVTKATTLTITDCPCTISVPVYVKTSTTCADKPAVTTWADVPVKGASTWVDVPVKGVSTWADVPVKGASTWADVPVKGASTSTGWNPVATWKGAADRVNVGAGLAGVVGVAALLL